MTNNQVTEKQLAIIGMFVVVWGHFENYINFILFKNEKNWLRTKVSKNKKSKELFSKAVETNNIHLISGQLRQISINDKLKRIKKNKNEIDNLKRDWGPIQFRNVLTHESIVVSVIGAEHNDKCPRLFSRIT